MNLGVECAARRDTAAAIKYNEEAVAIDSAQTMAHYNLGLLYLAVRNYGLADKHISSATAYGLRDPSLFQYAGDVCLNQKEYNRALRYYSSYLEMVPSDNRIREIRDRIQRALPGSQNGQ